MTSYFSVTDLFCGAGGSSLGAVQKRLSEVSGIEWSLSDGKLSYKAPHFGYQR